MKIIACKPLLAVAVACLAAICMVDASHFEYPTPAECLTGTGPKNKVLAANKDTVHWGYFYEGLPPKLVVSSGDKVTVEMITHHAGDDYEKMIQGDPGVEDIYAWGDTMNIPNRGASGSADGVHVMTGPIYVCGAEPGDVLQVVIQDLYPRENPSTGKTFGSNAAAWWGFHNRAGFVDKVAREVITIYEIIKDAAGLLLYAVPDYQFRWSDPSKGYTGPTTSCIPETGVIETVDGNSTWGNSARAYSPGVTVLCIDGQQKWEGIYYSGLITSHPTGTEDYSIRGKFRVPINLHIGNIGLAPKYDRTVDSVPPMMSGGNMDDRRIGKGASLFLPVQVKGALLSAGDAHASQGDSELDGTGIETSITGVFKIILHKAADLPKKVQKLTFPLLENKNEYVIHGYTVADYLQLDPPGSIYGMSSIDKAMNNTYIQTRDFLMRTYDLTEDQVVTAITVGVDFGITQVVDGNWGVHAIVPKYMFEGNLTDGLAYRPKVMQGTSLPSLVKPKKKFLY